jgi:APA family basic amino acid/polyamine antiporter
MVKLKRTLGLFDTFSLSLGAIIGAGIFVLTGIASQTAGPAVILSIIISGMIASLTGISVSQLVKAFPKEGGEYEYGYKTLSPFLAFLSGWIWCLNKIVIDSVIALGFATYVSLFLPLQIQIIAIAIIAIVTIINYFGLRATGNLINLLVIIKVGVLIFFVLLGIFHVKLNNFLPFSPHGVAGILQASAIMFFAYVGFIRPIYVVEEVKEPKKNVPKGIFLGLIVSAIIYFLVTFVAIGLVGSNVLGSTDSPLALAISTTGFSQAVSIIIFGAMIATFSVLLGDVLGLSRMIFAMGRRGDYPRWFGHVEKISRTPRRAVLFAGLIIGIPTLIFDLRSLTQVASFLILVYFAFVNLSAIKLKKGSRRFSTISVIGIISTLILAFSLSASSILIGFLLILFGIVYFLVKKKPEHLNLSKNSN